MPRAFLVRIQSRGLAHDAELLAEPLRGMGYDTLHVTHPFQWKQASLTWAADMNPKPRRGDLVIFIENVCFLRDIIKSEARMVLLPNAELLSDTHVQWANAVCDDVWHKCRLSQQVYTSWNFLKNAVLPKQTVLGFTSRDLYQPQVHKEWKTKFLHLYGTSPAKGTTDLIQLWLKHPEWPTLQLVGTSAGMMQAQPAPNIQFRPHLEEKEHKEWMNMHGIHICPSAAEGWGHYIVEAMSCASVVLTTDAAPMNEHIVHGETGFLLPLKMAYPYRDYARTVIHDDRGNNYARWNTVSPEGVEQTITHILSLSETELAAIGQRARQWYLNNHRAFVEKLREIAAPPLQTDTVSIISR